MKRINSTNINTQKYWDEHIAEPDFGLRQQKYLELAGKGESIAEFGCGLSPFLDKARQNFQKVYGYDYSRETCKKAALKFPGIPYMRIDIEKDMGCFSGKNKFDVTVAGEVSEHLEEPKKLLQEMARITKRRIIISTAKMEYNDPEHLWEFTEEDLYELGKPYGKVMTAEIKSERFPGRSYLFLTIDLCPKSSENAS